MSYFASFKQLFGYSGYFFLSWIIIIGLWMPLRDIQDTLTVHSLLASEGAASTKAVLISSGMVFLDVVFIIVSAIAVFLFIGLKPSALSYVAAALTLYVVYAIAYGWVINDSATAIGGAIGGAVPLVLFWARYRDRFGPPAPALAPEDHPHDDRR